MSLVFRRLAAAALTVCLLPWLVAGSTVVAQQAPEEVAGTPDEPTTIPEDHRMKDLEIKTWGSWRQTASRDYVFDGKVTITWRGHRIQADRLSLTEGRYIEAEGNILIVWDDNRISGERITYDLTTDRGVIEKAMGHVQGDFIFWAKRAEKIGAETVRLKAATVTTCTQPVPYWSFYVTSAKITLDKYARMWNVLVRASKVPFFYSPYLLWPVKEDRALGLLLPEFHSNDVLGDSLSQQLFIPIGPSADITLLGAYYSQAGFGFGGEGRLIPNRKGAARLRGFYIDDKVSQRSPGVLWGERFNVNYNQTQDFRNGFRMAADVNVVSDFSYFSDFERDLNLISTPAVLQRIEFSRNGKWASVNAREYRRAQFLGTVINPVTLELEESSLLQQTLPEIEWRGRSNRLGRSPFYLQYEASLASIQQREKSVFDRPRFNADYLRGDAFPTISIPWAPAPWIDITPRFTYRYTYYTQQQRSIQNPWQSNFTQTIRSVVDQSLTRELWAANLLLVGPKINRIFRKGKPRQYKHAIEPRLTYGYGESFEGSDDIIRFDEVDVFNGAGNAMSYALVNRLFVKRPRDVAPVGAVGDETIMMPDGTVNQAGRPSSTPEGNSARQPGDEAPATESVEIASIEIAQRRSFDTYLSSADFDGDFETEPEQSRFGDILISGRYNPNPNTTLDVRSSYDILWNEFRGVTISGAVRRRLAQMRFSLVHRNGLGGTLVKDSEGNPVEFIENRDDTQLRFTTGFSVLRGKLRFVVDGTADFDPQPQLGSGDKNYFPNRAWRIQYSTQCCTLYFERLDRSFTLSERRDFYFRIDLKGIGKILQVTY
jgi:lipopolysaccharide assembly outer membrane protein LptD (OstA)